MGFFSTEFALRYPAPAPAEALRAALAAALPGFAPAAGRPDARGGCLLCSDAGVPFTHTRRDGPAPPFDAPLPADLFDLWDGDAPLRVQVTDFPDGQVLAVSYCHSLADAASLAQLLRAWSAAYQGLPTWEADHDRSFLPRLPRSEEAFPHPKRLPQTTVPYEGSGVLATYTRSSDAIRKLKERYGDPRLSGNDVLCGELCELLGLRTVASVVNFRAPAGLAPGYFGNAVTMVPAAAAAPAGVPAAMRDQLEMARRPGYLAWHLSQGGAPSDLVVSNVVSVYDLQALRFASAADDLMMGAPYYGNPICRGMRLGGMLYARVLPQPDGVKVVLMATAEHARRVPGAVVAPLGAQETLVCWSTKHHEATARA